jgi:hypothetical protein
MGSVGPSTTCFKTHQPVERRTYAMIKNFHLGLEIPMAVTSATFGAGEPAPVTATGGSQFGAPARSSDGHRCKMPSCSHFFAVTHSALS